jgi:hypothetical protein
MARIRSTRAWSAAGTPSGLRQVLIEADPVREPQQDADPVRGDPHQDPDLADGQTFRPQAEGFRLAGGHVQRRFPPYWRAALVSGLVSGTAGYAVTQILGRGGLDLSIWVSLAVVCGLAPLFGYLHSGL